ncbi:MAG: hypothetical protein MJK18_02970, partial [Bdellovibrionales bacterium]|nr:hypothetical protein [Bdellovibrionales bacterium]
MNTDKYFPPQDFSSKAHVKSFEEYEKIYSDSVKDPQTFWAQIAKDNFYWEKPFTQILDYNYDRNKGPIKIEWFKDG